MKLVETTRAAKAESAMAATPARGLPGGLAGWLLGRMRGMRRAPARLAILERIALAPRQSLALVEAEGRRFLVATSPEGTPAFYPLDGYVRQPVRLADGLRTDGENGRRTMRTAKRPGGDRDSRVSW
jgi:hypothetical protein